MWPGAPPLWSTRTACCAGGRWGIARWSAMEQRSYASSIYWRGCGQGEAKRGRVGRLMRKQQGVTTDSVTSPPQHRLSTRFLEPAIVRPIYQECGRKGSAEGELHGMKGRLTFRRGVC